MDAMIAPTGNIVWQRADGALAITWVFFDVDPEGERDRIIENGNAPGDAVAINAETPLRVGEPYEFKSALIWNGSKVDCDIDKARDVRREHLRLERAPLLAILDVLYQRADEQNDLVAKAEIVRQKEELRNITEHPDLIVAKTVDDLRAVKCPSLSA